MCRGDGADDGETESVAVLVDRSARIKPLERLEEAFNFSRKELLAPCWSQTRRPGLLSRQS